MPGAGIMQWGSPCRIGPPRSYSRSVMGWRCIASVKPASRSIPRACVSAARDGRKVVRTPLLFPVLRVRLRQSGWWYGALVSPAWCAGHGLAAAPAAFPMPSLRRSRRRERGGLIELPRPPRFQPRRPGADPAWRVHRPHRPLRRHEAPRARRGAAVDAGRPPAGRAGRRCGRARAVSLGCPTTSRRFFCGALAQLVPTCGRCSRRAWSSTWRPLPIPASVTLTGRCAPPGRAYGPRPCLRRPRCRRGGRRPRRLFGIRSVPSGLPTWSSRRREWRYCVGAERQAVQKNLHRIGTGPDETGRNRRTNSECPRC